MINFDVHNKLKMHVGQVLLVLFFTWGTEKLEWLIYESVYRGGSRIQLSWWAILNLRSTAEESHLTPTSPTVRFQTEVVKDWGGKKN